VEGIDAEKLHQSNAVEAPREAAAEVREIGPEDLTTFGIDLAQAGGDIARDDDRSRKIECVPDGFRNFGCW
jgi:hypothetical protein